MGVRWVKATTLGEAEVVLEEDHLCGMRATPQPSEREASSYLQRSWVGMFPLILTLLNREYTSLLESLLRTVSTRRNIPTHACRAVSCNKLTSGPSVMPRLKVKTQEANSLRELPRLRRISGFRGGSLAL